MANLAIKGHKTRGKEVIEILEMLGGTNGENYWGVFVNRFYLINDLGYIEDRSLIDDSNYQIYTLEEFLEKFPYKIGDKVVYENIKRKVTKMVWEKHTNTVAYKLDGKLYCNVIKELQPYKEQETKKVSTEFFDKYCKKCGSQRCTAEGEWLEECRHYKEETTDKANKAVFDANAQCCDIMNHLIKEETMNRKYNVEEYLKVWEETENGLEVVVNDNFELKEDNGKFYIIKKQPQYPKTYEECHKLMVQWKEYDCNPNSELILCESPIHDFCKIIVARNIYWKIAGEQMGVEKPWQPDYDSGADKYGIIVSFNAITKTENSTQWERHVNKILEFPTAEMRDVFLENFKDLIERCKDLL